MSTQPSAFSIQPKIAHLLPSERDHPITRGSRQPRGPQRARFWRGGVEARFWLGGVVTGSPDHPIISAG
jgi:hypothetical protein